MAEHDKKIMLERARKLRREMTPQERKLWYLFLRKYPVKFYKQKIIGHYIADFYCHAAKIVIELDGSQHYSEEGKEYDALRTETPGKDGIKVLRFSNPDVEGNFRGVCIMIDNEVKERIL